MRTRTTIHNIAKIEMDKKPKEIDGCKGTYTKDIIITDGKGSKLEITLFSDDIDILKIKGI